jgi:anti-sigma B factor antagonist
MTSLKRLAEGASHEILAISTSRNHDEYVILVTGELDLSGVSRMSEAFLEALDSDSSSIVLDLRGLEFLDSTGLHTILKAERAASEQDRGFVIVRGPRQVQRIFEISGIVDLLSFSDG